MSDPNFFAAGRKLWFKPSREDDGYEVEISRVGRVWISFYDRQGREVQAGKTTGETLAYRDGRGGWWYDDRETYEKPRREHAELMAMCRAAIEEIKGEIQA